MKDITFNTNGGRLSVNVTIGNAQAGSYVLKLWESQSNTIVMERSGNNLNPNDDEYELPLPTACNDGRIVECQFAVANPAPKPGDTYVVTLEYFQDGKKIGDDEDKGPLGTKYAQPQLFDVLHKGK